MKYVVAISTTKSYWVEAPNPTVAGDRARSKVLGVNRDDIKIKEDKEFSESPHIEDISTFDEYFGDDLPDDF